MVRKIKYPKVKEREAFEREEITKYSKVTKNGALIGEKNQVYESRNE